MNKNIYDVVLLNTAIFFSFQKKHSEAYKTNSCAPTFVLESSHVGDPRWRPPAPEDGEKDEENRQRAGRDGGIREREGGREGGMKGERKRTALVNWDWD